MTQNEYDVVVQFRGIDPMSKERPTDIPDFIWDSCLANGWLKGEMRAVIVSLYDYSPPPPPSLYYLTMPKGSNALQEFEQDQKQAKQQENDKADQRAREESRWLVEDRRFAAAIRRDWWKFALGILVGWLLSLLS